ncbi:MAG: allantoinase AllB [bacterium]
MTDLVIHGQRILTPEGIRPGCVHVRLGKIVAVTTLEVVPPTSLFVKAGENIVMPGIIDTHVHINEPGRTDWEGFVSGTRAAAAGGVTTLFDMPLNSIPATTTLAGLHAKRAAAKGKVMVNVGFIGGVVPGNVDELPAMHDAGITLFKCFLTPSGVDEFPPVNEADLRIAMPVLTSLGATLLVHAESPEHVSTAPAGDPRRYATYLASRPDQAETDAVALMIRLAEEFGTRIHIVHVSSAATVPLLRDARARGVRITSETCPHYLSFSAEQIADGETQFKSAPPIRDAATRDALWHALFAGEIDLIASDHSPCLADMKDPENGDFFAAWGGVSSLRMSLPAVWHEAQARGATLENLAKWMCTGPAELAGLGHRKGKLAAGYDADIIIWDTEAKAPVDDMTLWHKNPLTPYFGRTLTGEVRSTYVGGMEVYRDGVMGNGAPGRLIN